jgi:hypothetical protein
MLQLKQLQQTLHITYSGLGLGLSQCNLTCTRAVLEKGKRKASEVAMASLVFSSSDSCFCRPVAVSLSANFRPPLNSSLPHRHGHAFIVSTAHKASNPPSPSSFEDDHRPWTVHDSNALYRLHGWGAPYFSINAAGHLCVRPSGSMEGK